MRRVVISGMIGNALEWYDYALYGYMATIIKDLFFPNADPLVSLIATFGVFAAGFLMRPLGAVLFGYLGDKYGRKFSLAISILMMAVPTTCIGLLPTYAQIGVWAPVLLTIIRLFQGLSLGGEFSGSITFMVEHAPAHRRGLVGSASVVSLCFGMLLGVMFATLLSSVMPPEDFARWGWRIPFLMGILIGVVGFYIRACTEESPVYTHAMHSDNISSTPVREAFAHHKTCMLQAIGLYFTVTVPFYVLTVFMKTFMVDISGYSEREGLLTSTFTMLALMIMLPFAAHLTDKIGRKPVLIASAIGTFLMAYPMFYLTATHDFALALAGQVLFAVTASFYLAPIPTVLVEMFPTRIRYTGLAISYNVCAALFGGTAPMVCTWLIKITGDHSVVAYYLMVCAVISLVTLYFFKDRYREPLN